MAFRAVNHILEPDSTFADLAVFDSAGLRRLSLTDDHAAIAGITLKGCAPQAVWDAFDRARSIFVYAWFDYDLLVVGENQAFSAFELALKIRSNAERPSGARWPRQAGQSSPRGRYPTHGADRRGGIHRSDRCSTPHAQRACAWDDRRPHAIRSGGSEIVHESSDAETEQEP
jgi:hypothetical protein